MKYFDGDDDDDVDDANADDADDGVVGHDWDRLIHRIDVVVKRKVDASFHADNENYSILCAAEKKKKKLGDGIGCAEGEERN